MDNRKCFKEFLSVVGQSLKREKKVGKPSSSSKLNRDHTHADIYRKVLLQYRNFKVNTTSIWSVMVNVLKHF